MIIFKINKQPSKTAIFTRKKDRLGQFYIIHYFDSMYYKYSTYFRKSYESTQPYTEFKVFNIPKI